MSKYKRLRMDQDVDAVSSSLAIPVESYVGRKEQPPRDMEVLYSLKKEKQLSPAEDEFVGVGLLRAEGEGEGWGCCYKIMHALENEQGGENYIFVGEANPTDPERKQTGEVIIKVSQRTIDDLQKNGFPRDFFINQQKVLDRAVGGGRSGETNYIQTPLYEEIIDGRYYQVYEKGQGDMEKQLSGNNDVKNELGDRKRMICGMLGAMQQMSVGKAVHRDVKPANFLLMNDGGVQLMDFGLAALPEDISSGDPNRMCGTIGYMPPEMTCGRSNEMSYYSDWYAFALSVLEVLFPKVVDDTHDKVVYESEYEELAARILGIMGGDFMKKLWDEELPKRMEGVDPGICTLVKSLEPLLARSIEQRQKVDLGKLGDELQELLEKLK